jgi:hypothetical protein
MMKGAWEHFTSWWVYPVLGAIALTLLALAALQIAPLLVLLLFRATVVLSGLAYLYDHRWRRPKQPKHRRRHPARPGRQESVRRA